MLRYVLGAPIEFGTGVVDLHFADLAHPVLGGGAIRRSLAIFALMFVFHASLSAILMNHYSHPKSFYAYILLDPRFFRLRTATIA